MSVELMIQNCKTEAELRSFCTAQNKTLMTLMKTNKKLQDENEELKKLVVNGALPVIRAEGSSPVAIESDEIEIAKIEINKLKLKSMDSEPLMLEESKKLEIYVKILSSRYKDKADKQLRDVQEIDADSLLALVESK